jgi:hypothetical protein
VSNKVAAVLREIRDNQREAIALQRKHRARSVKPLMSLPQLRCVPWVSTPCVR